MDNGHAAHLTTANVPAGATARETFEGQELEVIAETAASAVAAQAQALVHARYAIALRNPRDMDDVRVRLLKECRRPSLAEVAIYSKPVGGGKKATGLSIRFVETALRCMMNTCSEKMTIYDGPRIRIVRITVCDLESNTTYPTDITIEKVVERKSLNDGRIPISSRRNTNGETTYLVPATEDELLNKENSLTSKSIRTNGLRIIPGDLQDECEATLRATMAKKDAEDPDAARRKLVDAFAALNIMPSELAKYLGHDLGSASPAELQDLREAYSSIRDGETTWPAVLAAKLGKPEEEEKGAPDPKAEELKSKLEAARQKAQQTPAPPAATQTKQPAPPPPATARERVNKLVDLLDAEMYVGAAVDMIEHHAKQRDLNGLSDEKLEALEKAMAQQLEFERRRKSKASPSPAATKQADAGGDDEVDGPETTDCGCANGPAGRHHPKCSQVAAASTASPQQKTRQGDLLLGGKR